MADVGVAIEFVLRQEDSHLSGVCTHSPADRGGLTRFGIASKWHPDLVKAGFYSMNGADALVLAKGVYASEYADFLQLAKVRSQQVANALLSFGILENAARSALLMQQALNRNDVWRAVTGAQPLSIDGSIGPATLQQINSCPNVMCADLVKAFVAVNRSYLQSVASGDAADQQWLRGWMNRCDAVAAQV